MQSTEQVRKLVFLDVRRAFVYAAAIEEVCVEQPSEARAESCEDAWPLL